MSNVTEILNNIEDMTASELTDLIEACEKMFRVSATLPKSILSQSQDTPTEPVIEEKSEYNAVLTAVGDKKIDVMKAVREACGLTLAQSKAAVDGIPFVLKEGMSKADAEALQAAILKAGGTVELQ